MSDILRRIITRFEAQPGNVRAVLGGMSSGYTQASRSANTLAREQSYLNNQLRAFGTTMRYAIAGTAIFGAAGTISTLSQIQTQLGQISALSGLAGVKGPRGESVALVGKSLDDMAQQVRAASINVVQPVSAINEAILNLMSTSQGLKSNEIVPIVQEMAKGATLAQTPIENLTQAAASMNIAFQQTPSLANFQRFSRQWFTLIGLAPGARAAAPQVIQQLGPMASIARLSRINQEQMMALTLGVLRFGGSPSTSMRGLQYLMQGLAMPSSSQAGKAMQEIGLTPSYTAQYGGWASLMKIIKNVAKTQPGMSNTQLKQISSISDEDLDSMSETGKLPPALMSGPVAAWARKATGRIHAARALVVLAAQYQRHGDVLSLQEDLNEMMDRNGKNLKAYIQGWNRFLDRAKLPQAAVALSTLGTDIATAFEPILNFGAERLTGLSKWATKHQGVTSGVAIAGGITALLYGGYKGLGIGALMRGGGRGVGALAVAQGLTGGQGQWAGMPGESATHPAYVWVVGTMFGPGGMFSRGVPGAAGGAGGAAAAGGGIAAGTRASRFGTRFPRFRTAGALGAGLITAYAASDILGDWVNDAFGSGGKSMGAINDIAKGRITTRQLPGGYALLHDEAKRMGGRFKTNQWWLAGPDTHGYLPISSTQATQMSKALRSGKGAALKVEGKATVDVNINQKNADGTTTKKKVTVPVELFGGFNDFPLKAPTSRGQSKTTRG